MPIVLIVGNKGSGKTLTGTRYAKEKLDLGYEIVSNYKMNFRHTILTEKDLKDYARWKYDNKAVFLDEAHIYLDCRMSMTKRNRLMSYWYAQTRKRNIWLFLMTQRSRNIDVRAKQLCDVLIKCKMLHIKGKQVVRLDKYYIEERIHKVELYNPEKYYDLYDTNEIIQFRD